MKKLILLVGIFASLNVFAMVPSDLRPGEKLTLLCSFRGGMDYAYNVRVVEDQIRRTESLLVSETTIAGVRKSREQAVRIVRSMPGAPVVWRSKNYSLTVNFTTAPNPRGRVGQFAIKNTNNLVEVMCTSIVHAL